MDVDPPHSSSSTLKRSSSAPMINILPNSTPTFRENIFSPTSLLLSIPRTRRFSASFSPNNLSPQSPSSPLTHAIPSRINQIKHEEGMDVMCRETAHEKEVRSKLQMSQSWEDLTLDEGSMGDVRRSNSLTDPLHVFTPPLGLTNSPSPTRTGKQCFSPSMTIPVRSASFSLSPSPSPSPTRKAFATRRSQSPITLRPSLFGVKRKFDVDMETSEGFLSPAKRQTVTLPERVMPHPLTNSLSSNNSETTDSPEQMVPQEIIDITDSMSNSSNSPCGTFKPVDPAPSSHDAPCSMDETST